MPELYKIWFQYTGERTSSEYPLEKIITVLPYYREDVVSTDPRKLEILCERLNMGAGEDEHYYITSDSEGKNVSAFPHGSIVQKRSWRPSQADI